MKLLKILAIFSLLMASISTTVLAQGANEVLINIMVAFLGQLPPACFSDFGSQLCLECMAIGKILPLALLTSLFFFAFYYVMRYASTITKRTQEGSVTVPGELSGTELRIAAVVGIVIALLFLHSSAV